MKGEYQCNTSILLFLTSREQSKDNEKNEGQDMSIGEH